MNLSEKTALALLVIMAFAVAAFFEFERHMERASVAKRRKLRERLGLPPEDTE